jgi:AcrR family transcriptional regulator
MGIYTRFGSRAGMLEAIYRYGFARLRDALVTARDTGPPGARVLPLALAYRRFALANPPLYALMFERPLPDFDPSPDARSEALGMTFGLLVDELGDARRAYLVWTAIHGAVSIELTHLARSALPGFVVDTGDLLAEVVTRLGTPAPPGPGGAAPRRAAGPAS